MDKNEHDNVIQFPKILRIQVGEEGIEAPGYIPAPGTSIEDMVAGMDEDF